MKLRFSPEQAEWLRDVTGEKSTQEAVDFFVECMRKERINAADIMTYIEIMMRKRLLPPGGK